MAADPKTPDQEWMVHNYCVAFIDLLGQRDAMRGQSLLIPMQSEEQRKAFDDILRNSIGAIIKLQERAENMLAAAKPDSDSLYRAALSPDQQTMWDKAQHTRIETQRWSDGLVSFVSLGDANIKCQVRGVFDIFCLAGTLCLLGLATGQPIRGAIEIAWGVELRPGELYGPAVVRAYELENEIAQYPRIVVGLETVGFLKAHVASLGKDYYSQIDRDFASLCLGMLAQDVDGHSFLHYLGDKFQFAVTHELHGELYDTARKFILSQLAEHRAQRNTKLAFRYSHLLQYFDAHPPTKLK